MNKTKGGLAAFVRQRPEIWISVAYFVVYLIGFVPLERATDPRFIIHCRLDDLIPFGEWGIVPYVCWYLLVPGMLLFYLCRDKADYLRLCFIMYVGMTICLALYYLLPTGLELRHPIPRDNLLCLAVALLRRIDTPTNVCPSIHVSSTVGIAIVALRSRLFAGRRMVRASLLVFCLLVCVGTLVIQQHSVWDVLAGAALSLALMIPAYRIWPQHK